MSGIRPNPAPAPAPAAYFGIPSAFEGYLSRALAATYAAQPADIELGEYAAAQAAVQRRALGTTAGHQPYGLQEASALRKSASSKKVLIGTGLAVLAMIGVGAGVGLSLSRVAAANVAGTTVGNVTTPGNTTVPAPVMTPWLVIQGNGFFQADTNFTGFGTPKALTPFLGRGANMEDTRDCRLCVTDIPVKEVLRRIDALAAIPGVNLMRLTLEADNANQTLTNNASYAADVKTIIDYAGTKPNFYVQASIWIDPSLTEEGRPTAATGPQLKELVKIAGNNSHVFFGVSNEPQSNYNHINDTLVYDAMNQAVAAIREQEAASHVPTHIVAVQGTRGWAGDVSFYEDHPIIAGNGSQVAYEIHTYFNNTFFQDRVINPSKRLPMLIGEFGPPGNTDVSQMHLSDANELMVLARSLGIPHMAWTFNPRCGPSLLDDLLPKAACPVIGGPITLNNTWGQAFVAGMGAPWAL